MVLVYYRCVLSTVVVDSLLYESGDMSAKYLLLVLSAISQASFTCLLKISGLSA